MPFEFMESEFEMDGVWDCCCCGCLTLLLLLLFMALLIELGKLFSVSTPPPPLPSFIKLESFV